MFKKAKKMMKKFTKRNGSIKMDKQTAVGICIGIEVVALLALIIADYRLRSEIDAMDNDRSYTVEYRATASQDEVPALAGEPVRTQDAR